MVKQRSNDDDWKRAWAEATKKHSRVEIVELKDKTEQIIAKSCQKPTIIGYSGGKDSLVLRHMAEHCLDKPVFLSCLLQNEFPRFEQWLKDTAPNGTAFVVDEKLSLEFLDRNPEYVFPVSKKEKAAYVSTFHGPTFKYILGNDVHQFMTGKRTDDGNICGKVDENGMHYTYMSRIDMKTMNPIARWTHSQLLAYIQYFGIELPEIYSYPNGFRFGTHPWTERRRLDRSYRKTFDEIMMLDDTILPEAAKRLSLADLYLQGKLEY